MATDDKYDRQTRLWGGHGQKKLAHSHLVMLGSTSYGSECLKNLVLPALGEFTIVDDAIVCAKDFSNEFMVTRDSLGKPRAEVIKNMMLEMNPDVKGNHIIAGIDEFISKEASQLAKASMIVICDATEKQALDLGKICENSNASLVILRQYGLLGYLRIYKREHCIIETKREEEPFKLDLRVSNPFPELEKYAESFDFENMESI